MGEAFPRLAARPPRALRYGASSAQPARCGPLIHPRLTRQCLDARLEVAQVGRSQVLPAALSNSADIAFKYSSFSMRPFLLVSVAAMSHRGCRKCRCEFHDRLLSVVELNPGTVRAVRAPGFSGASVTCPGVGIFRSACHLVERQTAILTERSTAKKRLQATVAIEAGQIVESPRMKRSDENPGHGSATASCHHLRGPRSECKESARHRDQAR